MLNPSPVSPISNPSPVSPWPRYPAIPIFLDRRDQSKNSGNHGNSGQTLQIPSPQPASREPSIRYITINSPVPPNFSLKTPKPHHPRQQSQASYPSLSPIPGRHNQARGRGKEAGLGIIDAPTTLPHITLTPTVPTVQEKGESSPNFAQRIEKKLWLYNSSNNVVARWLLEIISWIISAICMGAIVVVLFVLKDKRLPRLPLDITLNAFVAVLARIASAALVFPTSEALGQLKWSWFQGDSKKMWDFEIFDNASRGPWGSFLLLIRTKFKTLAALGAAVILLSLALDPFFQQVVEFPGHWTLQGNGSIPRVLRYGPRYGTQFQAGVELSLIDQDLMAVAEKFFYDNGTQPVIFGNGTRPEIPLSCPTSNCTWPPYETLGICSECADVSQLLTFACLEASLDWYTPLNATTKPDPVANGTACGYFLNATSSKPILMSGYIVDPVDLSTGEALIMRTLPLITNPSRNRRFGGSINFRHVRNPINDFLIVTSTNGSNSVYRNETPIAKECVLSWCVKTIKSSYFWANYEEEVLETVKNTTSGPFPWQTQVVNTSEGTGVDTYYTEDVAITAPLNGEPSPDYGVSNVTALSTVLVLDDIFPSFITVDGPSAGAYMRVKVPANLGPFIRKLDVNPWDGPNNITRHLDRMATALTNVIRSSNSSEMIFGEAYSKVTFVSVKWVWLSLPLGLLLFSLVFLVGTVIKSSREKDQVGVWKTSAIATLLYGLPDDMQKKITASSSVRTPRAKAKELRVKMLPKMGWRVSGNLFSPMPPDTKPNGAPPGWI
ncbi:hypothetical protein BCR34DRAFT_621887 [Clohesyomyces aquaticus]|uniref:DUF3176 domain containing protein n=1 Tax=Clohesyomyces aquaticus TaxID=1231657 RepID=A0A1Y2A556_9PLEO|nr:hypothetical protein BCR34DRAFT_621887 [Clohesyomyces aquaticus]